MDTSKFSFKPRQSLEGLPNTQALPRNKYDPKIKKNHEKEYKKLDSEQQKRANTGLAKPPNESNVSLKKDQVPDGPKTKKIWPSTISKNLKTRRSEQICWKV